MSLYTVTVEYRIVNEYGVTHTLTETFVSRATDKQYVKEKYHRYTHENYGDVSRELEVDHVHPIGDEHFEHRIVDISEVERVDNQYPDLRQV